MMCGHYNFLMGIAVFLLIFHGESSGLKCYNCTGPLEKLKGGGCDLMNCQPLEKSCFAEFHVNGTTINHATLGCSDNDNDAAHEDKADYCFKHRQSFFCGCFQDGCNQFGKKLAKAKSEQAKNGNPKLNDATGNSPSREEGPPPVVHDKTVTKPQINSSNDALQGDKVEGKSKIEKTSLPPETINSIDDISKGDQRNRIDKNSATIEYHNVSMSGTNQMSANAVSHNTQNRSEEVTGDNGATGTMHHSANTKKVESVQSVKHVSVNAVKHSTGNGTVEHQTVTTVEHHTVTTVEHRTVHKVEHGSDIAKTGVTTNPKSGGDHTPVRNSEGGHSINTPIQHPTSPDPVEQAPLPSAPPLRVNSPTYEKSVINHQPNGITPQLAKQGLPLPTTGSFLSAQNHPVVHSPVPVKYGPRPNPASALQPPVNPGFTRPSLPTATVHPARPLNTKVVHPPPGSFAARPINVSPSVHGQMIGPHPQGMHPRPNSQTQSGPIFGVSRNFGIQPQSNTNPYLSSVNRGPQHPGAIHPLPGTPTQPRSTSQAIQAPRYY